MTMNDLHLHHPQKKTLRVATLAEKKAIQDECQLPLVSLFLLQKVLLDKCLLLTNLVSTYGSYMEVDLDFSSNRKLKNFLRSPAAFLAEAVRKCLNHEEEQKAKASGRILGCRWVLTWKTTPPEDLEDAAREAIEKSETTVLTADGKARVVLLGYQHPDIAEPEYRSSVKRRSLRLWMTGVKELREGLQVSDGGLLRILKDFYGSTTGGREPRNDGDRHRVIGYISGHVDDFNGDTSYPRWLQVKDQINKAYGWGTVKSGSYRHVGADIVETHNSKDGRYLEINQDFYTETLAALADLDIDAKMWH
ncbi:unnamed protein product [Durusdinium trenchii]|uniref:Uncharacterized protein n=1 Tax=Durusdinium trenchii TaxID=1381693 RepID=A0ABP0PIC5_9DINO